MVEFRSYRFLVIPVVLLLLQNHETSSTIIIPTLMMATAGGILMGKMTLGGLMMMMMAANQQQNGQSFLKSLGAIPPPSGTYTSTGGESIPLTESGADPFQELIVRRRILRLKRDTSNNNSSSSPDSPSPAKNATNQNEELPPSVIDSETQYRIMRQVAASDPLSCLPQALCGISATPPSKQSGFLNDYTYLLKQVLTRDEDVDDLDKEDDNISLEEFEKIKFVPNSKKKLVTKSEDKVVRLKAKHTNKKRTSTKKKNNEESSEEEEPIDDEELNTMLMKEQYDMEHMANEEMLDDEPDYFPYAIRDSAKGPWAEGPPTRPEDMEKPYEEMPYRGVAPSELHQMSESQLDDILANLDGKGGPRGPGGPGGPGGHRGPPGGGKPPGGSFLSGMMPKVSMGMTASKGDSFGDDSFFSGFKRSIQWEDGDKENNDKLRLPTSEEEKLFQSIIKRRIKRMNYINDKRQELANITDPVEQFRIAAEFGAKVKSPRQCRVLFSNCPFNYTQVLEMIAGLRKVILGQPLVEPAKPKDTVVELRPVAPPPPPPPSGTKNIINVNTGSGSMGGITSIQHELPNGEKVEINLKMTKTGLHSSSSMKRTTRRPRPKRPTTTTTTMSPILSIIQNKMNKKKKPPADEEVLVDEDVLFDEDEQSNDSPENEGALEDKRKQEEALNSLESLKATMLAIQKINDITVKRQNEGKPVTYPDVLADLKTPKGGHRKKATKSQGELGGSSQKESGGSSLSKSTQEAMAAADKLITASEVPEPDPQLLNKLLAQNSKPKAPKDPYNTQAQKTASSLLALSLIKVEDDEFEEDLPAIKPVKGTSIRVKKTKSKPKKPAVVTVETPSTSTETLSPSNQKLNSLLESIKEKQKLVEKLKLKKPASDESLSLEAPLEDEPEDEEDDDDDDEESEEEEDDVESPNFNDDKVVIPGDEYSRSDLTERNPTKKSTLQLTRSSSSVEQRPVEEREFISVPVKTDETSAGTIIATQTFSKRKTSSSKESKGSRRKPKILYPYDSVEFPRLIPL